MSSRASARVARPGDAAPAASSAKRVIVSGGSRGLGAEICAHLLARGHSVASFARSATDLTRDLAGSHGGRYLFDELDACDHDAVTRFVRSVDEVWGGIDALVNNAAIGQDSQLVHTSVEQISTLLRVNLEAPIVLTRSVLRRQVRAGRHTTIVNVGSIGARQGYPGLTVYAATKAALEGFTRALAREYAGRATVNVVAPGFFESEMSSVLTPEQQASIVRRTPSGRLTDARELMPVVDLLIEGNTNVNGSVIDVDGGALA